MLELWLILFGSVDVSETFGSCPDHDDRGTTRQSSQTSSAKRPNSWGIFRPKLQQTHSRVCVLNPLPPLIQSSEQSPTISKPLEILAEAKMENSHQGTAQRPGVVSCDELLVLRDVSIPPGTRSHLCLRSWKVLTPGHTRKAFLLNVWISIAPNWSWRVDGAWALSSWSCCVVTPSLRNFFRCEHDSWCHQPLRSRIRGPSSLRHEKMENARKLISRKSPSSWMVLDGQRRVHFAHGTLRSSSYSFLPPGSDRVFESVSVPQPSKCHSVSLDILAQHPSSDEREAPQRMQAMRDKHLSGSRLFGAASSNTRIGRNLRNASRGSHPWNQPRLCLHQRPKHQYILHLFPPCDVVASRVRAYGFPC